MKTKEQRREESIQHIMTNCVHFTGIQHDACKAGVNYHELCGNGPGCFAHLPCTHDEGSVVCEKCVFPTREQAEAQHAEREKRIERVVGAMNAAHADAKAKGLGKGNGGVSSLPCPACNGGELRYSVASYNGHMHAACSTKDCCSWME